MRRIFSQGVQNKFSSNTIGVTWGGAWRVSIGGDCGVLGCHIPLPSIKSLSKYFITLLSTKLLYINDLNNQLASPPKILSNLTNAGRV